MNKLGREELLRRVTRAPAPHVAGAPLDWDDIGYFVQGLVFAARPVHQASHGVTERYGLGPRGAWILNLVAGGLVYSHELAKVLQISRSLMSSELGRLTEAGLLAARADDSDRRHTALSLTPLGEATLQEVRDELGKIVTRSLAAYAPEDIRLCARILGELRMTGRPSE